MSRASQSPKASRSSYEKIEDGHSNEEMRSTQSLHLPIPITTTRGENGDGGQQSLNASATSETTITRDPGGEHLLLPDDEPQMERNITWYKLAILIFLSACSSPFGMEDAIRSGGAFFTLLFIFIFPIIYIIPSVYTTMELSSWMPSNEGSVLWVQRAFGPAVGFGNAAISASTCITDIAVYSVLFTDYLNQGVLSKPLSATLAILLRMIFVTVGTCVSVMKAADFGTYVGSVLCVLVLAPLLVGIFSQPQNLLPNDSWLQAPSRSSGDGDGRIVWGSFIATMLWMYTGFDQVGFIGGEVSDASVLKKGLGATAVMTTLTYFLPVIVCLPLHGDWSDGYFARAFNELLPGLGVVVGLSAAISSFALFVSTMILYSRNVWAVARMGWLPQILTRVSVKTNSPYICVLLLYFGAIGLSFFDFNFIVTVQAALGGINYSLGYLCFITFRYRYPVEKYPRPYVSFNGKKWMAWLLVIPPILLHSVVTITNLVEDVRVPVTCACVFVGLLICFYVMRIAGYKKAQPVKQSILLDEEDRTEAKAKEEALTNA